LKRVKSTALLMTYALPDSENRLKTQLKTLLEMGFEVHTLGFGSRVLAGVSKHITIPQSSGFFANFRKGLIHLMKSPKRRFYELRVPQSVIDEASRSEYHLIVAHDLELLPLILDSSITPYEFKDSIKQVDLHELHEFESPVSGTLGIIWRLLAFWIRPYHEWLLSLLSSRQLSAATVVNQSIGEWYVSQGYLKEFTVIRNCAPHRESLYDPRISESLEFVYHGKYAKRRGLEHLVKASLGMRPVDTLHFILTGNRFEVDRFRSWALTVNQNLVFHEPVEMSLVSTRLSEFDVEVIYFEPVTKNLALTLPNKFFEAVQGHLAIVSGPSKELAGHVSKHGLGKVTRAWGVEPLSLVLGSLSRGEVEPMRKNSERASRELSREVESKKLRSLWSSLLG